MQQLCAAFESDDTVVLEDGTGCEESCQESVRCIIVGCMSLPNFRVDQ